MIPKPGNDLHHIQVAHISPGSHNYPLNLNYSSNNNNNNEVRKFVSKFITNIVGVRRNRCNQWLFRSLKAVSNNKKRLSMQLREQILSYLREGTTSALC